MVLGLFPVDPQSGEDKYFVFAKGSYKVGRKGCDIIIKNDKGVSRIHAELFVDAMASSNSQKTKSRNSACKVRIKDCSKYGTFITRNDGSVCKVRELPNKETSLSDGDRISFGTGNASYIFSFVPFVIWVYSSEPRRANHPLQDKFSSIGAQLMYSFTQECTHVLVDELMPLREDLLEAIAAKKPCISSSWVMSVAEEKIRTEIPHCSLHTPTITVNGESVKLSEPRTRETFLEGYTFVLDSIDNYKFSNQLQSLLDLTGAKVSSVEGFSSTNLRLDTEKNNQVACVIPDESVSKFDCFNKLSSVSKINEMDLICAVLTAKLDRSVLISPSVVVSSSCSTDETIIADSEAEDEATTSAPITTVTSQASVEIVGVTNKAVTPGGSGQTAVDVEETLNVRERTDHIETFRPRGNGIPVKREPESENLDIIYSQCLIVRDLTPSIENNEVLNFKRFRKKSAESGNSFVNLIPFSQYPYKESNNGNEDVTKSMKDEKRRKQSEAMAEDLFNNERGRKRGVSGTLHQLLTKG